MEDPDYILAVENLHTHFSLGKRTLKAVDGASLRVRRGSTLGLVGESGCGKSVMAHSVIQVLPPSARISGGRALFHSLGDETVDLLGCKKTSRRLRELRGGKISMIFQDPMSSLNPVYRIGYQIAENIRAHERVSAREARDRAVHMLELLSIPQAGRRINDYPHQFSGGMKQRVMIAMGLVCNPELLIADEPTTALDVTIQAQILDLLQNMRERFGFTVILITHNIGIVADLAEDIAVMYMGKIVESGAKEDIFLRPAHPYTRALLKSVPVLGNGGKTLLEPIRGNTPDPSEMPPGCAFAPRCDYAFEACSRPPPEADLGGGHRARCFRSVGTIGSIGGSPHG
jgi:oligopeptide/dipeptide ABC transporter ATP-binding protein